MLKTWLKISLILVLVFILIAGFFRHTLCRFLIENTVSKATGLKLSIAELNLDVLSSSLYLRGITLFNHAGFKDPVLAKAKEIFIGYDLLGSLGGRLHFRQLNLDISEINIIRNKKGDSNLSAFRKKKSTPKSSTANFARKAPQEKAKANKRKGRPGFLIDNLEVSLKKVTFINYKAGVGQPAVIIFTTEGPFVFKNISDFGAVVDSVSVKGGLRNLLDNLLEMIPQDILKTSAGSIQEKIKVILPKIK